MTLQRARLCGERLDLSGIIRLDRRLQRFTVVLELFGDGLRRLPGLLEDLLGLLLLRIRQIERLHHAVAGHLPSRALWPEPPVAPSPDPRQLPRLNQF